ncbi:hypothetical protein A7975_19450 [Bacillus sp. FJAT-26390]|nr:hypothetical protein A7975_19450 [Bacillus sp. FJAT-26390]
MNGFSEIFGRQIIPHGGWSVFFMRDAVSLANHAWRWERREKQLGSYPRPNGVIMKEEGLGQ